MKKIVFIFNKTWIKFSLYYINWIQNLCLLQSSNKKLFLKTTYLKESLVFKILKSIFNNNLDWGIKIPHN